MRSVSYHINQEDNPLTRTKSLTELAHEQAERRLEQKNLEICMTQASCNSCPVTNYCVLGQCVTSR